MGEDGGKCLKYFKRGWNRKEGRSSKDLKKKGQAGSGTQGGGCLEGRGSGVWNHLRNYDVYIYIVAGE